MSYEISRYSPGGALARRNSAELARVEQATQLVVHKIRAMGYTSEFAINRAVLLQLAQKAAEEIAPNGAESYAAIVQTATVQIVGLLGQLGYSLR